MLVRIVKMTFAPDKVNHFIAAFNERKNLIAGFAGCSRVELMRDIDNSNIFFTYSHWDKTESLEAYRKSELFNTVWNTVKQWFTDKPEAWSMVVIEKA